MLAKALSFGMNGLEAYLVTIEADVAKGLPSFTIVGLPDNAIRESKERVRSAIKNCGFTFPQGRITINLAPADTKKEGPSFDLAIALALLGASEQLSLEALKSYAVLGELSLSGGIKSVTGALAAAITLRTSGLTGVSGLVVPAPNAEEAALADGTSIYGVKSLEDAVIFLNNPQNGHAHQRSAKQELTPVSALLDFEDVKGQNHVKRGLEIASAGGHNCLLIGPPGSGKTMLARRFSSILPPMTSDEALEITRIHSVMGTTRPDHGLMTERPFRTPHHTSSNISLVGGGTDPRPGEVTLAHNGILFLDELPEFSRGTIECLRQPLEDHHVTIARASRTLRFPARFTLLAAMNPCPCGHLGDRMRPCRCTSSAIRRYLSKISGPLLDRIDIHLDVPALRTYELLTAPAGESSSTIRARVVRTRERQIARFTDSGVVSNARMTQKQLRRHCKLDENCNTLMSRAIEELGLSARAHDKVLKVARTIADLEGAEDIHPPHLAEAISYRSLDKMVL